MRPTRDSLSELDADGFGVRHDDQPALVAQPTIGDEEVLLSRPLKQVEPGVPIPECPVRPAPPGQPLGLPEPAPNKERADQRDVREPRRPKVAGGVPAQEESVRRAAD